LWRVDPRLGRRKAVFVTSHQEHAGRGAVMAELSRYTVACGILRIVKSGHAVSNISAVSIPVSALKCIGSCRRRMSPLFR
jgi:hypothetical protein